MVHTTTRIRDAVQAEPNTQTTPPVQASDPLHEQQLADPLTEPVQHEPDPAKAEPEAAATEGITRFEGRSKFYDKASTKGKAVGKLEKGTDVKLLDTTSTPGWSKIEVEGGPHVGKTGFIQAKYLEQETAAKDYEPRYEKVNVVLFQGADNDPRADTTDIKQRRYFANTAKNLAGKRKNTVGCDLDSGNLLVGEPVEYNTGQDIAKALQIIGAGISGKPLRTTKEGPVYAKIGEVHVLGHSTSGIYGSRHNMAEGLYTDDDYKQRESASKPFEAEAPEAGKITKLLYNKGDKVDAWGSGSTSAASMPLFEMLLDSATDGKSSPMSFFSSDWQMMAEVVAANVAVGDKVAAGDVVLELLPFGSLTDKSAKLGDIKPTVKAYFAKDVRVALHGCATANTDEADPFAEKMYDMVKGALPKDAKPVVAGRPHVGDTRSTRVRVFDEKNPEGTKTKTAPKWFSKGLKK